MTEFKTTKEKVKEAKWVSPFLPSLDLKIIGLFLALSALLRGADYHLHPDLTNMYSLVEGRLPWEILSWWCFTGGALLLLGYLFERHFTIFVGHVVMAVLGTGLTTEAAFVWVYQAIFSDTLPPYGPLSRMILMSIPTLLHLVLLIRMGPFPTESLKTLRTGGQK